MSRVLRYAGVLWLVSQLLLGQQFALAHMIGHTSDGARGPMAEAVEFADEGDAEYVPSQVQPHVCMACIAAGGLAASLTHTATLTLVSACARSTATTAVSPAPTLAPYSLFRGRAPPFSQS